MNRRRKEERREKGKKSKSSIFLSTRDATDIVVSNRLVTRGVLDVSENGQVTMKKKRSRER